MGQAMCILCYPVGVGGGALASCFGHCAKVNIERSQVKIIFGFACSFLIAGLISFIFLRVQCSKFENNECVSTGGDINMTGSTSGVLAGLFLGIGTALVLFFLFSYACMMKKQVQEAEVETETETETETERGREMNTEEPTLIVQETEAEAKENMAKEEPV